MSEYTSQIDTILLDMAKHSDIKVNVKGNLFSSGLLDSLNIIVLISKLQEMFNIELSMEDLIVQNFETVDSINDLLKKYLINK